MAESLKLAFALGGLAGNNAHGAGFLDAALELGVRPHMISCTSGQILWVFRYLAALSRNSPRGLLRHEMEKDIAGIQPTGNVNIDLALLFTFGKPGVCQPARMEFVGDFMENWANSLQNFATKPFSVNVMHEFLQLFPCRLLVPDFPKAFFQEIADRLNDAAIGIVFNSYDPRTGNENVYLNDVAREALDKQYGDRDSHRERITYREIDDEGVQDALWLYEYGFDLKTSGFVDGAYYRGIMLSELQEADVIFAVRPINHCWKGRMPHSAPDMMDMKTEIGFDGSYCGERYQIKLINKLLKDNRLASDAQKNYHEIQLEEIEIKRPRGFFDYVIESMEVFDDAYRQGFKRLKKYSAVPAQKPVFAEAGI